MEKDQLLLLLGVSLILLSSTSYLSNSLLISWDSVGHRADAQVFKDYVFPNLYGWNSFFLFGYPIDSYPPMGRMLLFLSSFAFDMATAAKLITVISVLAVPISFYLMMLNFGYNKDESAASALAVCIFMAISNYSNSASLYSAFFIGAFANFISIPFFFLALAFYERSPKLSAIFCALVILSHLISVFNLFVALFGLLIFGFLQSGFDLRKIARFSLFAILAFALAAFWLLPFIYNLAGQTSRAFIPMSERSDVDIVSGREFFLSGLALCCVFFAFIGSNRKFSLVHIVVVFLLFMAISYAQNRFIHTSYNFSRVDILLYSLAAISAALLLWKGEWKFPMLYFSLMAAYFIACFAVLLGSLFLSPFMVLLGHINRFESTIFFFCAGMVGLACARFWSTVSAFLKKRGISEAAATLALSAALAGFALYSNILPYSHPSEAQQAYIFPDLGAQGRTIFIVGADKPYSHAADYQYFYRQQKPVLHGLFVEQAPLSHIAFSYIYSFLMPNRVYEKVSWGSISIIEPAYMKSPNPYSGAGKLADHLWVTDLVIDKISTYYLLNKSQFEREFELAGSFESNNRTFLHYRLGNFSMVQARDAFPVCPSDFGEFSNQWFALSLDETYYLDCSGAPAHPGSGSASLLEYKNGYIHLNVSSPSPLPVLVKEAYNSNWKAYQQGGQIPIYQAVPGFMMVFAQGEVVMRYENNLAQVAGIAVSCAAVAFLFLWDGKGIAIRLPSKKAVGHRRG